MTDEKKEKNLYPTFVGRKCPHNTRSVAGILEEPKNCRFTTTKGKKELLTGLEKAQHQITG